MTKRLRGRAGQRQRQRRLDRTDGMCEWCNDRGFPVLATVVDHIKPLALGGSDEDSNTRNLCDPCHADATALQFNRRAPVKGKGVDRRGRPTSTDHPWNRRSVLPTD